MCTASSRDSVIYNVSGLNPSAWTAALIKPLRVLEIKAFPPINAGIINQTNVLRVL